MLHPIKLPRAKPLASDVPQKALRPHASQAAGNNQLLALDLGLKGGMALYGQDGRLRWYHSQHFASVGQLKRAAAHLIGTTKNLDWILSQGDYSLAAVWERVAMRQGVRVQRVSAQAWRHDLLDVREQHDADEAAKSAEVLARQIIAWSQATAPMALPELTPDAAGAIVIGLWGVLRMGWLTELPEALRDRSRLQQVVGY